MRVLRLSHFAAAALLAASVVACGGGNGGGGPNASTVRQAAARLDTLVPQWMERTGVPGVAVSVVHGGQTVYAKGFGLRREDGSETEDADTVFQLASVSKPITATILAALAARACGSGEINPLACCPAPCVGILRSSSYSDVCT